MLTNTADWAPEPDEYSLVEAQLRLAPAVFALCELDRDHAGELVDGRVFAWGMAFADHVETVSTDGNGRGNFRSVDSAVTLFARTGEVRVAWPSTASAL